MDTENWKKGVMWCLPWPPSPITPTRTTTRAFCPALLFSRSPSQHPKNLSLALPISEFSTSGISLYILRGAYLPGPWPWALPCHVQGTWAGGLAVWLPTSFSVLSLLNEPGLLSHGQLTASPNGPAACSASSLA